MSRSLRLSVILLFTAGVYGTSDTCCDRLTNALSGDKVFKPSNTNYAVENQKYWSSTAILSPACVFVPESSADVSTAIKLFTKHNCQFAVRGGGHTTNPGWAGTNSGILVSLSKLTTVQVSQDTQSVVVGAGNRWGDVYAQTGKHNVTVAGGRISQVGVSGFLLGGGLSFLMHKEGFAANNVLSYEVVLANGKVTTVTAKSNSDLFKALKGGTGNFGIVTSFTLQTFPVNNIYAGYLYYTPDQYDNLFPLMEAYARQGPESDPKTHMISVFLCNPSQNLDMATFYTAYSEPVTSPPAAIVKPILDHLGYMNNNSAVSLPHITWCPTGALSFLPLHAAGDYGQPRSRVFDYVISSYTPTLTALLASSPDSLSTSCRVLAVGQTHTLGHSSLPGTARELAYVQGHVEGHAQYSQLKDSQATVPAVLDAMEHNDWVHLACHAHQNVSDPTKSGFFLHKGTLDVAEINRRSFKGKGLAFLSACQTATGDERLADEAVHLASGMLMAGYSSVIGTMWSVHDEDAPLVADKVYAELMKVRKTGSGEAGRALHNAVAILRETVGEQKFERWVPYIHIGS